MSNRQRLSALTLFALVLGACSSAPTPRELAREAVTAMGGTERLQGIRTLSMSGGTGSRLRLGQTVRVTDQESPGQLKNVVEVVDLSAGRASLDYEITIGAFVQHRHDILTRLGSQPVGVEIVGTRPVIATSPGGLFSWGTQNSPEFLLKRNVVTIALAAAESLSDAEPAQERSLNGRTYRFGTGKTRDGQELGVYFDPDSSLIATYEVVDTESMLGDVPAQYLLSDYRPVEGVTLPHRITVRKGGLDYSDVQFTSIAINDAAAGQAFAIPESAAAEAQKAAAAGQYSPMRITRVGSGVYHAQGYSHHTMVVEFPEFLALMDAPYTETQTKMLWRAIGEQFPTKPVRYVALSHHHYDHIGGVRAAAAMGATVLVETGHEPLIRPLLDARHTYPQDELDAKRAQPAAAVGAIETYQGMRVISQGGQRFELHAITGSPHAEPMVLGYVSSARALFQPDLYTPPSTMPGGPAATHLAQAIRDLGLRVDVMVGGHGGVGTFADFLKSAAPQASTGGGQ